MKLIIKVILEPASNYLIDISEFSTLILKAGFINDVTALIGQIISVKLYMAQLYKHDSLKSIKIFSLQTL